MLVKAKVLYEKMIADFRRLKPPAGEQTDVDRILAISEEHFGVIDRVIAAAKKNDTASVTKLVKKANAMSMERKRILHKLGATACG